MGILEKSITFYIFILYTPYIKVLQNRFLSGINGIHHHFSKSPAKMTFGNDCPYNLLFSDGPLGFTFL